MPQIQTDMTCNMSRIVY